VSDAERLHEELRLDDAAALLVDTLSPAEAQRLCALVGEAAEVHAGVDAVVAALPAVARGRVGKLLRDGR
jgi:hypothetical protein